MVLVHSTDRRVRTRPEDLIETLMRPEVFLKKSKHVANIDKIEENVWTITLVWRKFGMKREYDIDFTVYRDGNTVVYESVEGSPHKAKLIFVVVRDPKGWSVLNATAEFDLGGFSALLGKGDFAKFVEEVVDAGIKAHFERLMRKMRKQAIDCRNCEFYEATRRYCYAVDRIVEDPTKPPCGGALYAPVGGQESGAEEKAKPEEGTAAQPKPKEKVAEEAKKRGEGKGEEEGEVAAEEGAGEESKEVSE